MKNELYVLRMCEVYEPSGSLLLVTADAVEARAAMGPDDRLIVREWMQVPLGAKEIGR